MSKENQLVIKIVKRLIELKHEFREKGNSEKEQYIKKLLYGKSDGIEIALTVIDGFTGYTPEINKLIEDSRK